MNPPNWIRVNIRYMRSIKFEHNQASPTFIYAYVPTPRAIELLDGVVTTLDPKDRLRAWNLVGPYEPAKKAAGISSAAARPDLARRFARQPAWCRDDVDDDKLKLALIAQLANDFLVRRRDSILSRRTAKRAVP